MNFKVDEYFAKQVFEETFKFYNVGSQIYGLHTKDSDTDIIIVSNSHKLITGKKYQYTKDEFDYTIMNEETFNQKAKSGDDLVCFEAYYSTGGRDFDVAKVVRAYSGIAHRDLLQAQKLNSEKKLYHSIRCQFIAEELLQSNDINLSMCAKDAKDIAADNEVPFQIVERIVRLRSILKGN